MTTPDIHIHIHGLGEVTDALTRMEQLMASAAVQLNELRAQIADTTADVLAKLAQLAEQVGTLDPQAQATFDEIKAGVESLDTAVGDADGSDTQPL